ncbi:sulfotransferase family protein [Patescibacteria group bacterium]|nr:sulfotransferase family protein [Patescibacteria group bacterium]
MPKTGGTTIHVHLKRNYEKEKIVSAYRNEARGIKPMDCVLFLSEQEREKAHVVCGHNIFLKEVANVFNERENHKIVFLRDQAERVVSLYNHHRSIYEKDGILMSGMCLEGENGKILSFSEWFEVVKDTIFVSYTKYLLHFCAGLHPEEMYKLTYEHLEQAKHILDGFIFVGITENPEDFSICYSLIGVPVSNVRRENVSTHSYIGMSVSELEDMKKYIRSSLPYSQELYEYAKELNKKQKKQLEPKLAKSLTFA